MTQEVIGALTQPSEGFSTRLWRWCVKPFVVIRFAWALHSARVSFLIVALLLLVIGAYALSLSNFLGAVTPLKTGLAGIAFLGPAYYIWQHMKKIAAEPLAKELETYIKMPSYIKHLGELPVMSRQVKTLCDIRLGSVWSWPWTENSQLRFKKERRLLFVIDDLDRCDPNGIVKTFEAVRLILDIKNVMVVIAVDQRIALPALACKYHELAKHHESNPKAIARDYLAKVIHLPIHLPQPDDVDVARFLQNIWADNFMDSAKEILASEEASASDQQVNSEEAPKNRATDSSSSSKGEGEEETIEKPQETLEEIINDINRIDIKTLLSPKEPPKLIDENIITEEGLSDLQKRAFYYWLRRFDLRNPRQIKRLYNAYNTLQAAYSTDQALQGGEHRFPLLVAMFGLEAINQTLAEEATSADTVDISSSKKTRQQKAKQYLFSQTPSPKLDLDNPALSNAINEAAKVIKQLNNKNLQTLVEPFVLPAVQDNSV